MRWFICIALFFGLLTGCTTNRALKADQARFAQKVITDTQEIRESVSATLERHARNYSFSSRSLAPLLEQEQPEAIADFSWMTEQGAIIAYSDRFSVIVLLEPQLMGGDVFWKCVVHPQSAAPNSCDANHRLITTGE